MSSSGWIPMPEASPTLPSNNVLTFSEADINNLLVGGLKVVAVDDDTQRLPEDLGMEDLNGFSPYDTLVDLTTINNVILSEDLNFEFPLPSDKKLKHATLVALETCSLTPLIKEELYCTIQSRRLAAGKPELVLEKSPPVLMPKAMTKEELQRAQKRRQQNRRAAQRFRERQKEIIDKLNKKCDKLRGSNSILQAEVKRLRQESQVLKQVLTCHLHTCPKARIRR